MSKLANKIGICPRCLTPYSGAYCEGPFLHCKCGTTEWTGKWPMIPRFFGKTRESRVLRVWRFKALLWNVCHWKPHLMRTCGGWTFYFTFLVVNYGK